MNPAICENPCPSVAKKHTCWFCDCEFKQTHSVVQKLTLVERGIPHSHTLCPKCAERIKVKDYR